MSDHEEFIKGFSDGSGLRSTLLARQAYAVWLEREGYSEVHRIDLESGGYEAGVEVGRAWRQKPTNQ